MQRRILETLLLLALVVGVLVPVNSLARGSEQSEQSDTTEERLRAIAEIPDAAERARSLRGFLADTGESDLTPIAHLLLVSALIEAKAPARELIDATNAAVDALPRDIERARIYGAMTYAETARALAARGEELQVALELTRKAGELVPDGDDFDEPRAMVEVATAAVRSRLGEHDAAIAVLLKVTTDFPADQTALEELGRALAAAGRTDQAIDAYIRALAVFQGDELDRAPLEALYRARHGSLDGLEARLEAARGASLQRVALDERRVDAPAPAWQLRNLEGKSIKMSDFRGKVVVIDFWGTWCPPCRLELPHIQALHERYGPRGLMVLGINYEQPEAEDARMRRVRQFVTENRYTFPVMLDHEFVSGDAYSVEVFPTVVVIDREGRIRYRNEGYSEGIDQILAAQVESLL